MLLQCIIRLLGGSCPLPACRQNPPNPDGASPMADLPRAPSQPPTQPGTGDVPRPYTTTLATVWLSQRGCDAQHRGWGLPIPGKLIWRCSQERGKREGCLPWDRGMPWDGCLCLVLAAGHRPVPIPIPALIQLCSPAACGFDNSTGAAGQEGAAPWLGQHSCTSVHC